MLQQRALSATIWSGADIFLRQGLQFAVSVVLARLLSSAEFGTIALLYLFTGIASAFVDSGFSAALIQQQGSTHSDESTVFWFNLLMGALFAMALWAAAPEIADFYNAPILIPLTGLMALNIFLSALGSIHGTLLTKRLDFRTQMKIGGAATFVSGAVAIDLAWRGYGVWALAAQTIVATALNTALLWLFNPWRPGFTFSKASARQLFGFGGYLLASGLMDIGYNRVYTLLIGKFYGVRELGYYNRADSTKQLPINVLTGVLSRVAFPLFSAAAGDTAKLRRGVQLSVRGMMLVNVPVMLVLSAVAEPLVLTLFGAKWLPSVPTLRVLCFAGFFWPLHVINLNVLMAQGYSQLFFRLEVIKKVLGMGLLVIGATYGVTGIAWSQVAFSALAFIINSHYTERYLDYGTVAQTRDFLPVSIISVAIAAVVHWLQPLVLAPPWLTLLMLCALGSSIFLLLGRLFRLACLREAQTLLRRRALP